MGVAYYANYLIWFEVGRTEWLRAYGVSYREMEAAGLSLPVIEAHCEYRQPVRYDDELEVKTEARLQSPVRIEFRYEAIRRSDQVTAATGYTVHAALDATGRPRRLPDPIKGLFS